MAVNPQQAFPFVAQDGRRWAWNDVQTHLQRLLHDKYPRVNSYIMEDAVSEAVLDLLSYWQDLESSQDGEYLNFEFALRRAMHRASTVVLKEVTHLHGEVPRAWAIGPADDEDIESGAYVDIADPAPGPDDLACDLDEVERVRRFLADMTSDELVDCFELLEEGSQEDLAERLGITQQAVSKRVKRAAGRVRARAADYGLVP